MIPSTAPPFAMTRWTAQTRQNFVSVTPYNYTDTSIHGFQGTHQPAIWIGESGQAIVAPGAGQVQPVFENRGMSFKHEDEIATASYYSVLLDAIEGGHIHAEQSASKYTLSTSVRHGHPVTALLEYAPINIRLAISSMSCHDYNL